MIQIFLIVFTILIEYFTLKTFFSMNLKEYQGFSTRFFSTRKDEKISTESIVFWIFITPFFSILTYLITLFFQFFLNVDDLSYGSLWMISIYFWFLNALIIIFLGRCRLVNWLFVLFIAISSTVCNWYIARMFFTGDLKDILPDSSSTAFQFYLIVGVALTSILQVIYQRDDYETKRTQFISKKVHNYLQNYKVLYELEQSKELLYLALSILLVEDFERPRSVRMIENLLRTKTRNIAQNDSIDDKHSVFLLVRQLECLYAEKSKNDNTLKSIVLSINRSKQYVNDVIELKNTIYQLDKRLKIIDANKIE